MRTNPLKGQPKTVTASLRSLNLSIFDHVAMSDEQGMSTFYAEVGGKLREANLGKREMLRELIENRFQPHKLFLVRLERDLHWMDHLSADGDCDQFGSWRVNVNLAKLFLLPGRSPQSELGELSRFYGAMKPFFEATAARTEFADVQIHCPAGRPGEQPRAAVRCRSAVRRTDGPETDAEHTSRLTVMVAASPVLQSFLAEAATVLLRNRPPIHSVTEEQLYGSEPSPWYRHYMGGAFTGPVHQPVPQLDGAPDDLAPAVERGREAVSAA